MSYNSNSNYTRVESFGTPSAFDPNNINQSQTTLQPSSETTINACVSLENAVINTYSDLLRIGTIPHGAIIKSITYNGSQLLPVNVQVLLYISEPIPPNPITFGTSYVFGPPPVPATAPPSNPGTINGSVTFPVNFRVPAGHDNPTYLWLNLVAGVPATNVVNVTVKYVM